MVSRPTLSINAIRDRFEAGLHKKKVVVSAPTGSGKSTAVPIWCADNGRVLVIEPRRVACRGLSDWVSTLMSSPLGDTVGYAVRDEHRFSSKSRIVFATPGVVIRWLTRCDPLPFEVVIIDEFHERSLEVDLLLALLQKRFDGKLVVMSATMAADRVADHLDAALVAGTGRCFDVAIQYIPGDVLQPTIKGLHARFFLALERLEKRGLAGDVLVFLPGKSEIARLREDLGRRTRREVLAVHGGLRLSEQNRVFDSGERPRIILSTNVAETSITIPNIDAVIDAGLVRRTRYANGRGFLTLSPVAMDSADQRSGRAGRVKAGICFRLWSEEAVLHPMTPPEIHRESLVPLLLAAAACGERLDGLTFLDPPKPYAAESAASELRQLRAVDGTGQITERGKALFRFPLDAPLASLLVEAEREGCLLDAIDLVSALSLGRPLFLPNRPQEPELDLRADGCDALAHIRAIRIGVANRHQLNPHLLAEARLTRKRLLKGWSLPDALNRDAPIDRSALVRAALRSDPKAAFVARRRRGRTYWAGGGTEICLARESAVDEDKSEAIAMLASMAVGEGLRKETVFATAVMPVRLKDLAAAGLGEERVTHAARDGEILQAEIARVFAGRVIDVREEIPEGKMARDAVKTLLLKGRLFKEAIASVKETLDEAALVNKLNQSLGQLDKLDPGCWSSTEVVPDIETWINARVDELGIESGEDLALLSETDFFAAPLPDETRKQLRIRYPNTLSLGNVTYSVAYDVVQSEVMLNRVAGNNKQPPSLATLPAFRGFKVKVKHHSKVWVLKDR